MNMAAVACYSCQSPQGWNLLTLSTYRRGVTVYSFGVFSIIGQGLPHWCDRTNNFEKCLKICGMWNYLETLWSRPMDLAVMYALHSFVDNYNNSVLTHRCLFFVTNKLVVLCRHSGLDTKQYRYYDPSTCGFDFKGAVDDILVSFTTLNLTVSEIRILPKTLSNLSACWQDSVPAVEELVLNPTT